MSYIYILAILIIGSSGIIAQVVLLRELLVSFYGNELTLGLILANWIICEAFGVFIIGKIIDGIKNKINIFVILQVLFSLNLPLAIYFSRIVKSMLGIPFGEAIGLLQIFYSSLFIMAALSFCHGALFSCSCKIYSSYINDTKGSIGKVYAWETAGTIAGAIAFTYIFIPRLNSFQIAFIVSLSNLIICLLFFKKISKIFKYVILFLILFTLSLLISGALNKIHAYSIKKQWKMQDVLDYRNSVYGNIAVVQKEEQQTLFYNGLPIITTPYPDITFVQEFGNLPLLFHPYPRDILVISGGAGGLINEILKHPIKRIDYAELDPLIIKMLEKYPSGLTQKELSDSRVNIINKDGRFFVKNTPSKYDVVLVGLSKPSDLATNRVFTQEFFELVKNKLKPDGILALYLPGSLTYLSSELRDLNACIMNGLKGTYGYVRIIPGDYNIFLASGSMGIMRVSPDLISQRIKLENIKVDILVPAYLEYRLDKRWLEWFTHSSSGAATKINRDFVPVAVYQMLVIWNKQFSVGFANILKAFESLSLKVFLMPVLLITGVLFALFYYKRNLVKLTVAYSIATTGFFSMLINLILIFSFQVVYGYLYHRIGLLISIFMAGTALGSIFMTYISKKAKNSLSLFIKLEVAVVLFTYFSAIIISGLAGYASFMAMVFIALFFISGLLIGLEFSLAAKMCLKDKEKIGFTSGLLYFCDLVGGWLAGIMGAVVFLPVLGLFNSCMVILFLKLSSLLLLVVFRKVLAPSFLDKQCLIV